MTTPVAVKRRCSECRTFKSRELMCPVYSERGFDVCRKCAPDLRATAARSIHALLAGRLVDRWW